jgi:hypothetical protein
LDAAGLLGIHNRTAEAPREVLIGGGAELFYGVARPKLQRCSLCSRRPTVMPYPRPIDSQG